MNTPFLNSMKRIFFYSGIKPFRREKITMNLKITGLILIAFVSFFVAGCNGNNGTNENKTDTVYVQPNNQRGGHEGEGMGDDKRGMDSMMHGDMDSTHMKRHN